MTNIKRIISATARIMQLTAYILLLPFLASVFYRRKWSICQRFCYAMCGHQVFRMLYGVLFALGIATVNMIYIRLTQDLSFGVLTLAVSIPLLIHRIGHPLLMAIRGSRQQQFFIMVLSLSALFIPHMLSFAASLYLFLVAAIFYPSHETVGKFQTLTNIHFYSQSPDKLVEMYFDR